MFIIMIVTVFVSFSLSLLFSIQFGVNHIFMISISFAMQFNLILLNEIKNNNDSHLSGHVQCMCVYL